VATNNTSEYQLTVQEIAQKELLRQEIEHLKAQNALSEQALLKDLILMLREKEQIIGPGLQPYGRSVKLREAVLTKPKELDFVLPGLLAGSVGSIVSPGGAGKSMLAMQITAQLAGAPDFLGLGGLKRGRAVYFAAEDPEEAIIHRFHNLCSYIGPEERELIFENLDIRTVLGKQPNLLSKSWVDHISSLACESRLIVLDTLRRFHLADENSSGEMNNVLNVLDTISSKTGCSIIFLHHANKGSVFSGNGDMQQASRGSSVLVDNIRWQAFLSTMSKEEAKSWGVEENARKSFVRFGISKQNYGIPIEDKWYRRHEGGILKPAVLEKAPKFVSPVTKEANNGFNC